MIMLNGIMNKKSIILLLILVGIFCSAAIIAYKFWNKPFKDALKGDAIKVTATQLFNDFNINEAQAQQKYVPASIDDKILEIAGEITQVGNNEDGEIYYMLKTNDEMFGVKCVMDKDAGNNAKVGDNVILRGFCVGYNMDVIVRRCKFVK